jgi:hypothetical protein
VALDLSALLASVYERGRYARKLRYDRPPTPPLTAEQVGWAVELIQHERQG